MSSKVSKSIDVEDVPNFLINSMLENNNLDNRGVLFDINVLNEVDNIEEEQNEIEDGFERFLVHGNSREQNFSENIFRDFYNKIGKDSSDLNCSIFELMKKEMVNVCPDDDNVKKRIIKHGYGDKAMNGSYLKFDYIGYLENEGVFDSTLSHPKCYSVVLGKDNILYGLEIALSSMKMGETSQFLINYTYAYSKIGILGVVPAESNILFEIHLYSFQELDTVTDEELTKEDKQKYAYVLKIAENLNAIANQQFKLNVNSALKNYQKAINMLEECHINDFDEETKRNDFLIKLLTDIAICYNKKELPKKACIACNRAYRLLPLQKSPPAKLLYHNAKALATIGDYKQAYQRIFRANKILPNNTEIQIEMQLIKNLISEKDEIEKSINKITVDVDDINFNKNSHDTVDVSLNLPDSFYSQINDICLNLINNDAEQSIELKSVFNRNSIQVISNYVQFYNLRLIEDESNFYVSK